MLPTINGLRNSLLQNVASKVAQGHECGGLSQALKDAPASYDALWELAQRLAAAPLRTDWTWVEPNDRATIRTAAEAVGEWPLRDYIPAAGGGVADRSIAHDECTWSISRSCLASRAERSHRGRGRAKQCSRQDVRPSIASNGCWRACHLRRSPSKRQLLKRPRPIPYIVHAVPVRLVTSPN